MKHVALFPPFPYWNIYYETLIRFWELENFPIHDESCFVFRLHFPHIHSMISFYDWELPRCGTTGDDSKW